MVGCLKHSWSGRAYPGAVAQVLKRMPSVYEGGCRDGIIGWVGRTYTHQRKDFKPKPPRLAVDKETRMVFQHDLVNPITYTDDLEQEDNQTRIKVEVKASGTAREGDAGEVVVAIFYTLTKALEPIQD